MLIKGTAHWCRIVGQPHDNKFTKTKQWSFDLQVDGSTAQQLLEEGMRKTYLKSDPKQPDKGTFLSFTRESVKKDGTPGKPFEIIDAQGHVWDQNTLIGNGSTLNVIVALNEREFRGEKFLKPSCVKLQVWDLVPYQSSKGGFPKKDTSLSEADGPGTADTEDKEW